MHDLVKNNNCTNIMQQKLQLNDCIMRRKNRKKFIYNNNNNKNKIINNKLFNYTTTTTRTTTKPASSTTATSIATKTAQKICFYFYKNKRKINKLLIIGIFLLTTITTATLPTTLISATEAATLPTSLSASALATSSSSLSLSSPTSLSSSTTNSLAAANANTGVGVAGVRNYLKETTKLTAPPSIKQLQKKSVQTRQLQQEQLFSLLTRNRQTLGNSGGGIGIGNSRIGSSAAAKNIPSQAKSLSSSSTNYLFQHNLPIDADNDDDDDEGEQLPPIAVRQTITRSNTRKGNGGVGVGGRTTSLEITGFVADDGEQYEKIDKVLPIAANHNNNNNNHNHNHNNNNNNNNSIQNPNCPVICKCTSDYFDCGKRNLDKLPVLPADVQILDLNGNKFNDTNVLIIKNFAELHKLNLKRNQLENIPKFTGLLNLKQLNLAGNRIQEINSYALSLLPKLKSLDLSRNYLHTLEPSYFPPNNRLAHLMLNSNEISSIHENAFETLGHLLDLELNSNQLTTLPVGVFRNLNKLRKLSLNSNHLEINWSTFKGLHSLQKLFLKSNYIRALQDGVFHIMRAIETIELDNNSITSIGRQGLFNLTKLHNLSLSNNSISRIELDTWEFTQSLFSLDLSHNNITEFKPQHLDCLHRLKYLNLGHNKIQYLMDNTFDCVKNLEDLNLRRNQLSWIIEDHSATPPFKALKKLKKLDLYGNNLKQINTKSLSGLANLELLNLGGNALATIQYGAFDKMQNLQKVIFKSLNFICDCALLWFRHWLQRNIQNNPQMRTNAVCGYPEHLLDRELLTLESNELLCDNSPKPLITQEPGSQLAVKGANITMECIAISPAAASLAAADELKIKWRHDNINVQEQRSFSNHMDTNSHVISTAETQVHHDQTTNQTTIIGYLRLYNVSYETAGKYQCVVSNAFGTTYSQKFKVSIGIHPSFLQIPSNLTIDSGDSARLVCSATGDPMPEMALQKFGGTDFPAATDRRLQVIKEENAFIIMNAKPIDTGIYTCTAESAAGEIKVNATLIVNDKPQPPMPVINKEIVLGKSSVIECLTEAAVNMHQAQTHREWYKDNKPFHSSSTSASKRYYFTPEKELLIIVNTQSMDAGHYRCEIKANSKTLSLQTDLIVVKENFSQNVIIIGIALLIVACILIGSLCIWIMLLYQKRKLRLQGHCGNGGGGGVGCSGIAGSNTNSGIGTGARIGATQQLLSSSHGSILDHTQLTTLSSTYLQHKHQQQKQQRPHSLADLDTSLAEQRNCLIITGTPNYEQLMKRKALHNGAGGSGVGVDGAGHIHHNDANGCSNDEEGITLEYIHRRNSTTNEAEQNHDHLSSKDSGTGSDAAVKRSIDDFTLTTMLPTTSAANNQIQQQQQQQQQMPQHTNLSTTPNNKRYSRASLARADTFTDDDDDDDDVDGGGGTGDFTTSPIVGVSQYDIELYNLNHHDEHDNDINDDERMCFLQNNNQKTTKLISPTANMSTSTPLTQTPIGKNYEHFSGNSNIIGLQQQQQQQQPTQKTTNVSNKCKTNLSTNFNTNAIAATTQAVDI